MNEHPISLRNQKFSSGE